MPNRYGNSGHFLSEHSATRLLDLFMHSRHCFLICPTDGLPSPSRYLKNGHDSPVRKVSPWQFSISATRYPTHCRQKRNTAPFGVWVPGLVRFIIHRLSDDLHDGIGNLIYLLKSLQILLKRNPFLPFGIQALYKGGDTSIPLFGEFDMFP